MQGLSSQLGDHAAVLGAVDRGLTRVARVFDAQLESRLEAVRRLTTHVEHYRGKMLRPMLVLVSGMAASPKGEGGLTREHDVVAAVIEMVHMATLVHDDVLDEADLRRKSPTINSLYGNEPAVILGDLLIASAYHLCSTLETTGPSRAVGRAAVVTASGELLQLHHRGDFDLSEETYFDIIRGKTAELIATACELGAAASGGGEHQAAALREFGLEIGAAFQIQDDILDLAGDETTVGKTLGQDLVKGKVTLPIIHHLRACLGMGAAGPGERAASLDLLRRATQAEATHGRAGSARDELLGRLSRTGSVEAAGQKARDLIASAKRRLLTLHASPARSALEAIADAVLTRKA
jgi:octaprenyl-diphosphate synthase